ncbi:MAG: hypothetical protein WBQ25_07575 [Nitrososphaeraceae archaeon]
MTDKEANLYFNINHKPDDSAVMDLINEYEEKGYVRYQCNYCEEVTLSLAGIATTLSGIQIAHADPQTPHGTCGIGGGSGNGAFRCAGNVGGFIVTPNRNCHTPPAAHSESDK